MTRDIFDTNVGTLDVIIYATLRLVGLVPRSFYGDPSIDAICEENARMLVDEFIGQPIQAIKIIREASGLPLVEAKAAWEQVLETYYGTREYHVAAAKRAAARQEWASVASHLERV